MEPLRIQVLLGAGHAELRDALRELNPRERAERLRTLALTGWLVLEGKMPVAGGPTVGADALPGDAGITGTQTAPAERMERVRRLTVQALREDED